jgi:cytochrome P450
LYFDPGVPEIKSQPYEVFREFRNDAPIQWGKSALPGLPGTWYVFGHEEAKEISRSNFNYSAINDNHHKNKTAALNPREKLWEYLDNWLFFQSAPHHTNMRKIITDAYRSVDQQELNALINASSSTRIKKLLSLNETFDIQSEYSYPYTVEIISYIIGIQSPEIVWFKKLTANIANSLDLGETESFDYEAAKAIEELSLYIKDLISWKKQHTGNDLFSAMLNEYATGNIDESVLVASVVQMLFAGQESVSDLIGNGIHTLSHYPEQFHHLRAYPELVDNCVSEILRYDTSVPFGATRMIAEDQQVGDISIKKGDLVNVVIGSCNHDPSAFTNPDKFDIITPRQGANFSFGYGIHYCIGAQLAKLLLKSTLVNLASTAKTNIQIEGSPSWRPNITLRGPRSLHVHF